MRSIVRRLVSLLFIISLPVTAADDIDDVSPQAGVLEEVVVVASKTPRPISDVIGQVSVINADFIERYVVENVNDLFRYEPGINIESSGTRFGASTINIRGIGGNRVAIEVDGIPTRRQVCYRP